MSSAKCCPFLLGLNVVNSFGTSGAYLRQTSRSPLPQILTCHMFNGSLARYVQLWVAHVSGMPITFSPPRRVSDPDMHHCTCVMHVPWCMMGSLTSGFLWSPWRGKLARHSRRMRNRQFYVSGKRPMGLITWAIAHLLSVGPLERNIKWNLNQLIKHFNQKRLLSLNMYAKHSLFHSGLMSSTDDNQYYAGNMDLIFK